MNLEQIIKDFEHEEKWCNEQMDNYYREYIKSDLLNEEMIDNYAKHHAILERVQFIKTEMESLLELY